jgi:outer membrane immunogenic protein
MSKHHKRRALLAGVAASALAASGHALAADLSTKAPVYQKAPLASPAHDWTGCYVGVHAGGGTQTDTFTPDSSQNLTTGGNGGGALAGGQAGCNAQLGQIVLGIEGEGAWAGLRDRSELDAFGGLIQFNARNRWSADVALRAGVAVDRALIYGKVGAAWGGFDFSVSSSLPSFVNASGTLAGLLLGGGIEYAFAPHWSARLEYDHVDYLGRQFLAVEPFPISVTTNVVTAGVNYRFDDTGVATLARPTTAALYTKAPASSRAYDWTGCYIGLHGGGETQGDGYTDVTGIGGLAGGQAGCNAQLGGIMFGVEGESAWTDTTDSYTVNIPGTTAPFQSTTRNRWSADAALRTGVAIDRTLVYGKAGVAWGRFDISASGAFVPPVFLNASGTLTGLLIGGGIEYAFAPHWSAKLEFDSIDYDSRVLGFNTNNFVFHQSISATTHMVKAGVNYQLSEQSVPAGPPRPSLPSAAHDWTGCYAGVHAGAGTQTDSQTETGFIALIGLGNLGGVNGAGGLAGGQAGCSDSGRSCSASRAKGPGLICATDMSQIWVASTRFFRPAPTSTGTPTRRCVPASRSIARSFTARSARRGAASIRPFLSRRHWRSCRAAAPWLASSLAAASNTPSRRIGASSSNTTTSTMRRARFRSLHL